MKSLVYGVQGFNTRCWSNRWTDFVDEVEVDCTRYLICVVDSGICHPVCFTVVVQTCACRWISGVDLEG